MTRNDLTSSQLITEYCSYLKQKNLAANTIAAYHFSVNMFFSIYPELTMNNLKDFRAALINQFLPATVNQRLHAMNHFLRFLEDRHPTLHPELVRFRMKALKLPRNSFQNSIISIEDCSLLEERLQVDQQQFWYFVVRFLVTTGVRVSELVQIKVEHLKRGYLDLYSKGGKIRRIFITDSLCAEALEWCREREQTSGLIFIHPDGKPVTTRGIHAQLTYFAARYGIDPAIAYPHAFRHRFAKNFLDRCGDISLLADLMGHESIETTRIYLTKSSQEQQKLLDEIVTW